MRAAPLTFRQIASRLAAAQRRETPRLFRCLGGRPESMPQDVMEFLDRSVAPMANDMLGALERRDFDRFLILQSSRARLGALLAIREHLSDREYWRSLALVWTHSDNIWRPLGLWLRLLSDSTRGDHSAFMSEAERAALSAMPGVLTIYRGYHPRHRNRNGLSFTLSHERAKLFATTTCAYGGLLGMSGRVAVPGGRIWRRTVRKAQVFAYKNERDEQEIIVLPARPSGKRLA